MNVDHGCYNDQDGYAKCEGTKIWRDAPDQWSTEVPHAFMTSRNPELDRAWYTILHGMSEPLIAIAYMHEAAGKAVDYPRVKIRDLYAFLALTFRGVEVLKEEGE